VSAAIEAAGLERRRRNLPAFWPCWPASSPAITWPAACSSLLGLDPDEQQPLDSAALRDGEIAAACPWPGGSPGWCASKRSTPRSPPISRSPGPRFFCVLIVLYKLGDAFAGSLTTAFLLKGLEFSQAEVGIANKIIGIWLTILGALVGGADAAPAPVPRTAALRHPATGLESRLLPDRRARQGRLGQRGRSAVRLVVVSLREAASLDFLLLPWSLPRTSPAAWAPWRWSHCSWPVQPPLYRDALRAAFRAGAVGRIYVSPVAGVLTETIGWQGFICSRSSWHCPA
jgi:PAT family beta-lactamase induction signal transducer AmpG